jgi:hypothetical protein
MRKVISALALTIALTHIGAGIAAAHSPTLQAVAECAPDGTAVINYTSTSWSSNPLEGENSRIDIYLNGVIIDSQAYVYPANSFSGSVAAPTGTEAHMKALAVDPWGNGTEGGQVQHIYVALPATCPAGTGTGRFTGGGSQIRIDNVRVTRGLTVHCDLLLSNNLEINWNGNQFHMTEHLRTVTCSDDPNIIQAPPAAPLDTLVGVGTGRYNGADGYTVEFTFVDYGEPGSSDQAALKVYQTANPANVVLNVPLQLLSGGNLQAHYDQPHK